MAKNGTTLVEVKTGYGLRLDTEVKDAKVIHKARELTKPSTLVCTYLGGHSIPSGSTAEEATCSVENQIPTKAEKLMNEGVVSPDD